MSVITTLYSVASVRSTKTEAWSLYMPLFAQFIHNALLEWSISEPNVAVSLAE